MLTASAGLSGNEVIRVGFPVVDDAGTVIGAVYAGINLTWLNTAISQWKLGEETTIDITDRNGILVARHPDPSLAGRPLASNLKPFLSAAEMGIAEVADSGGIVRLYGYVPVETGQSNGLAVFVGRDRAKAFADINQIDLGQHGGHSSRTSAVRCLGRHLCPPVSG